MLTCLALVATLAVAGTGPTALKTHIVDASVFKTGVALIVREGSVPTGEHTFRLDVVPEALDGTFWYGSTDGAKISDVKTSLRFEERTTKNKAQTLFDYLRANLGRPMHLWISKGQGEPEELRGVVLSPTNPPRGNLTLKTDDGLLRTFSPSLVVQLDSKGLVDTYETKVTIPSIDVEFTVKADKPSHVQFASLETGAVWQGSHLLTLDSPTQATIVSKAQVGLGGLEFKDSIVKVVSGLPNLTTRVRRDLAGGSSSINTYIAEDTAEYQPARQGRLNDLDPYSRLNAVLSALQHPETYNDYNQGPMYAYGGAMAGGMGGGVAPGTTSFFEDPGYINYNSRTMPVRNEDLYIYDLGQVSLIPGGRLTKTLLDAKTSYESLFVYSFENVVRQYNYNEKPSEPVVRSIVRLKNNNRLAWTNGPCMVLKSGAPLAKLEMPFTAPGQTADLTLGTAQDVTVERSAEELDRQLLPEPNPYRVQTVKIRVKVTVTNCRDEAGTFEITSKQDGEVTDAGGATLTKLANESTPYTVVNLAKWRFSLKPGEKKELALTFVRTIRQ